MSKRTSTRRFSLLIAAALLVLARSSEAEPSATGEWLYLVFTSTLSPQQAAVPLTMWLHPTAPESCARTFDEPFFPGHTLDHKAFAVAITQVTPEGYEVTFQRVDPKTQERVDNQPRKIVFERVRQSTLRLSDRVTVVGHYESSPPK